MILLILSLPIVLAWFFLAIELVLARTPQSVALHSGRPRFCVLIPAHNEEKSIGRTLETVVSELAAGDRCVVIADNCDDRTADAARAFPVDVVERHDPLHRGKGFALQAGVDHLRADPPEVVIVVDADCRVVAGSLGQLASAAKLRPAQGGNELAPPPNAGPRDRLSAFAFRIKNHVRPLGLARCGGPCLLFGTGMALPWRIVERTQLATGSSVEDMNLALDLALAGEMTSYVPVPTVRGELPSAAGEAMTQRKRWEHGHVRTALVRAPWLLAEAIRCRRWGLLLLAADLMVPPLALLAALTTVMLAANVAFGFATGFWWGAAMLAASLAVGTAAMGRAWWSFGRDLVPATTLIQTPFYILRKIPLYAMFLINPQRTWQRTAP